jgi:hypothetical protein
MATRNVYARRHVAAAYRSGLEEKVSIQLVKASIQADYEQFKIAYTKPESQHTYCPDFILPNGLIIETKGLFDTDDRKKHLLLQAQYPMLDIRFVFSRSASKLYKGAKSTYADWCTKYGFKFADKLIPEDWLKEKRIAIPNGVLISKTKKEA